MSKIVATNMIQSGNTLSMHMQSSVAVSVASGTFTEIGDDIVLCGLIKFKIMNIVNVNNIPTASKTQTISVRLSKIFQLDGLIYTVKVNEKIFFVVEENINKACWQTLCEYNLNSCTSLNFKLKLSLDVSSRIFRGFPSLHEDTDLTDFELRGRDGSVKVHKAVLAGYSPVMKTMLAGKWKETTSGFVEVDASKETLDKLKDYMYLHRMPEKEDAQELAVIASLYMMSDLEECCTVQLLTSLTAENASDLLDFAVKYNFCRVKLGILNNIQSGLIKVEDIIKQCNADSAAKQDASLHN